MPKTNTVHSLTLYRKMYMTRKAEERIQIEDKKNEMKTPMHMSMGEEAISAGVCAALNKRAQIFSTYRTHAVYLSATEDLKGFFAELYGKATGPGGGKGGSMHLANPKRGVIFSSAVVATNIAPALGAAFANRRLGNDKVATTFFGDGAVDEGVFWESINLACLWKLPVLFVYEDNNLAIHTPASIRHSYKNIVEIVKKFGCPAVKYDGTDVEKIYQLTESALKQLKSGPFFMSLKYYRYLEHVGIGEDFNAGYRSKEEFLKWQKIDPLDTQRARLVKLGLENTVLALEKKVLKDINNAVDLAKSAPFPEPRDLYRGVYE
ncbi:MAG: thiamine pyrophosphate-dependent dehydrogenase E1 component subunit alpha [Candidatus Yanofskybacteria bacterium]|nr:thiamine pyrophosphate-dependent dehydrogenase E1 component subunit alpha [Candidatus Yanofskybacteria bacterium]